MGILKIENLKISEDLYRFINEEVMPGTGVDNSDFWKKFDQVVHELTPKNKELIKIREDLQKKIDNWHLNKGKKDFNIEEYKSFLKSIGYLVEEKENFKIQTSNVDQEITSIAGPQLVVPVDNARYALNAANARWGSLYDSLYGTDVIPGKISKNHDQNRALKVINFVRDFLNQIAPIKNCDWKKITKVKINESRLNFYINEKDFFLKDQNQFVGFKGEKNNPEVILLKNNNLHIEIVINKKSLVGKIDKVGISNIILESAISTIVDNEDSVAAVDSSDKIKCYRNWLGLMKGDLESKFIKNGKNFTRKLNQDRIYTKPDNTKLILHGRALLLCRNVGHLMTNPSIILKDGSEIPEGIMDAFFTTLCTLHDFKNKNNSRFGSFYIVKPKMHGPDEVKFTNLLFEKVEQVLNLKMNTIKVGIMDEERRTTLNLKECIRNVKERIVFINTGFLDRTGDEIHTSFKAGPMIAKGEMKKTKWLTTYEDRNVDIGLSCGFSGKAQIGKGMWAIPDKMRDMIEQKINHPNAGANCAWVPSPTAATLHAMHYHQVDVFKRQKELSKREQSNVNNILSIPVAGKTNWPELMVNKELENNAQSILGYVVRWIDQGVGCSKVPDINNIGLMEDRATLRISSQHMANWIYHGITSKEKVTNIFKKMAKIVDDQNKNDKNYEKMSDNFENSIAFKAACDLVFKGENQPSGYTEPLLHKLRIEKKSN